MAVAFRVAQRLDFRMGLPRAPMPTASNNAIIFDQYRSDHGIGRSGAITSSGQP
jgi:hypothetical protein